MLYYIKMDSWRGFLSTNNSRLFRLSWMFFLRDDTFLLLHRYWYTLLRTLVLLIKLPFHLATRTYCCVRCTDTCLTIYSHNMLYYVPRSYALTLPTNEYIDGQNSTYLECCNVLVRTRIVRACIYRQAFSITTCVSAVRADCQKVSITTSLYRIDFIH